jgi:hypothetical protein
LIKNTWVNVIMILTVFALFTSIVTAQDATPNPPVGLKGNVSIGGNPAPPGTAITAKAGGTLAGSTVVQTAGVYGETSNNLLPVSADDGALVDIYVNGVKVPGASIVYHLSDGQAGKIFQVDLNVPTFKVIPNTL